MMSTKFLSAIAFIAWNVGACAEELKILSSNNVRTLLSRIQPEYEQLSGNKLTFEYSTAGAVRDKLLSRESADAAILLGTLMEEAVNVGVVEAAAVNSFARSSIGLVIKADRPAMNVSTASALKSALLGASSVSYSDPKSGAASGIFIARAIERLGIAEELRGKTILTPGGGSVGDLVASGKAEIGINQIPELRPVSGIQFLTPLAPEMQYEMLMTAAVLPQSRNGGAARDFVAFLRSPLGKAAVESTGMEAP